MRSIIICWWWPTNHDLSKVTPYKILIFQPLDFSLNKVSPLSQSPEIDRFVYRNFKAWVNPTLTSKENNLLSQPSSNLCKKQDQITSSSSNKLRQDRSGKTRRIMVPRKHHDKRKLEQQDDGEIHTYIWE